MVETKQEQSLPGKLWYVVLFHILLPFVITFLISISISLYPSFDAGRVNNMNARFYLGTLYSNLSDVEKKAIDSLLSSEVRYTVKDVIDGKKSLSYEGYKVLNTGKWAIDFRYLASYRDNFVLAIQQKIWQLIILFAVSQILVTAVTARWRYRACPYQERLPDTAKIHITLKELLTPEDEAALYDKLRGPHLSLGNGKTRESIKLFIKDQQVSTGFVFTIPNCSLSTYANTAESFDKAAQTSICSTNTSFPSKFFISQTIRTAVTQHLDAVNRNQVVGEKKRIQVCRRPNDDRPGIPTLDQFRQELKDNEQLKTFFSTHFLHESATCQLAIVGIAPFTEQMFLGDYIVYDGKLVLVYDYETCVLSMLVGRDIERIFNMPFKLPGLSDLNSMLP